jgi:hypothetical protein
LAAGLGGVVLVAERERWRAQDVMWWYLADRSERWVRDTGGPGPRGDPAAAEIWLGAHQPGTVPQVYRAMAAFHTGDARVLGRELEAMPSSTLDDRTWRLWVVEADRWNMTGAAETGELEPLIASLPPSRDRAMFESWLAAVEASRLHEARNPRWLEPLASRWTADRRTKLARRFRIRTWIGRMAVVVVFGTSAVVLSSLGLTIAARDDLPRPEYSDTTLGGRGDIPSPDAAVGERVWGRMRALERALSAATRIAGPLDEDGFELAVSEGLPTLIWSTGTIKLATPADLGGHTIWEVEVLLGTDGDKAASAILTLDRESGPRYVYAIDPAVVRSLREAIGLPVESP